MELKKVCITLSDGSVEYNKDAIVSFDLVTGTDQFSNSYSIEHISNDEYAVELLSYDADSASYSSDFYDDIIDVQYWADNTIIPRSEKKPRRN